MNARLGKYLGLSLALATLPSMAFAVRMSSSTYESERRIWDNCKSNNGSLEYAGKVDVYEGSYREGIATTEKEMWRCVADRSSSSTSDRTTRSRDRDPNTECNGAIVFDAQGGRKCQTAENTIREVKGRNNAMQQLEMAGAGALQVYNASNVPNSQEAALQQQAFNMKAAIGTSVLSLANNLNNSRELSNAEDEAKSAARGIKNAQQSYDDAVNAGKNAAGTGYSDFKSGINDKSTADEIRKAAEAKIAKLREQETRMPTDSKYTKDAASSSGVAIRKQQGVIDGANAFERSLKTSGLDDTAKEFNSFEDMRNSTRRGINESNNIAEQASQGASTSNMMAVGSALQSAQAIAQYRQLMQMQNNLGTLPGAVVPPTFALDTPGGTPTTPVLPPTTPPAVTDPGVDLAGDPIPALPNDPIRGDMKSGVGMPGQQYKPRQAQVSSGTGGRGLSGGSTPPAAGKNSQNRQAYGPGSFDYAFGSGGNRLNQFGQANNSGSNSDIQDAIKSLLGGEEPKSAEQKLQEFRELASVGDKNGSGGSEDDARTLFERVNEKYADLQNNGII